MRRLSSFLLLMAVAATARAGQPADDAPRKAARPSETDRRQFATAFDLLDRFGNRVWPGFGDWPAALVLYDHKDEFLATSSAAPADWTRLADCEVARRQCFRRPRRQGQAFAVRIGEHWAASMSSLDDMNARMARADPEDGLLKALARKLAGNVSPQEHALALVHEAFHAFQANVAPNRFNTATAVYRLESRYPFHEGEFAQSWDEEGRLLSAALLAEDAERQSALVRDFLAARDRRRLQAALTVELVEFEARLEWLEGLAKYFELELADEAASDAPHGGVFRKAHNKLTADFTFRLSRLGQLDGDTRFYLSGAAQARLLDSLAPNWKPRAMPGNATLETLLRESTRLDSPARH